MTLQSSGHAIAPMMRVGTQQRDHMQGNAARTHGREEDDTEDTDEIINVLSGR